MLPTSTARRLPVLALAAVPVLALLVGASPASSYDHERQAGAVVQSRVGVVESGEDYEPPLPPVRQQAAASAPNIILITTDDQTASDMKYMPKTRELLGKQGAEFTDAISPHPLCCPARAEIVSGQFAQNNGVHSNGGAYGGYRRLKNPHNTLPKWLYEYGYHTGMIGKFITHWKPKRDGVPTGWEWFDVPRTSAFGYYDFKMFTQGVKRRYNDGVAYSTTYATERTVDLIHDWAPGESTSTDDKPFFIWTSYFAPHGECGESTCKVGPTPEKKYRTALSREKAPSLSKKSYDAPLHRPNRLIAGSDVVPRGKTQQFFLDRIRSLQSVDDGVAEIVAALRATDELDNTYIVFTSDNGYQLGEHRYSGKTLPYEESLRVPLLVRGPGVKQSRPDVTATTVDLAPTIIDAAGARAGRVQDGRSLLPLLTRGKRPVGDTALIQAGARSAKDGTGAWMYRGVRTSRYTYTSWKVASGPGFWELFDRKADPFQLRNLDGDARYRNVQRELARRLSVLNGCRGTRTCFRDFGRMPAPRG